jgi:hypothetical protein
MLADTIQLTQHFDRYLRLLESQDLDQMVLIGGRSVIETTMLWGYLGAADLLLSKWVDHAVSVCDNESMLRFAFNEIQTGHLWLPATLMSRIIERNPANPPISFGAQGMRCIALGRLNEFLEHPDELKRDMDIVQAGWVARSLDSAALHSAFKEGLRRARQCFGRISEPTEADKALAGLLDKLADADTHRENDEAPRER